MVNNLKESLNWKHFKFKVFISLDLNNNRQDFRINFLIIIEQLFRRLFAIKNLICRMWSEERWKVSSCRRRRSAARSLAMDGSDISSWI